MNIAVALLGTILGPILGVVAGFTALGWGIGRLERRFRRKQRQATDWPEDIYPSPGMGYPADGDRL